MPRSYASRLSCAGFRRMGDRPSLGDPHFPLRAGIKSHTICESIVHLSYEQITRLRYVFWPILVLQFGCR